MKTGQTFLLGACLAMALPGCFVQTDDGAPSPPGPVVGVAQGALTVRWTVDEGTDPSSCTMGHVALFNIAVSTIDGGFVGEFEASCADFSTTISTLAPGRYVASAELQDTGSQPRTTATDLAPFTILANSNLIVDVDFPADSFR
jgi:hypothetical protein